MYNMNDVYKYINIVQHDELTYVYFILTFH